jgi:hypothetical protein
MQTCSNAKAGMYGMPSRNIQWGWNCDLVLHLPVWKLWNIFRRRLPVFVQ